MLLSARMLADVQGVNSFQVVPNVQATAGDAYNAYFQLVRADLDLAPLFSPPGRRYAPQSGATLQVTLRNIDDANKVVKAATQAYPTLDASIWYVPVAATDKVRGTVQMDLQLTEGVVVTRGTVVAALLVSPQGSFQ